jgi:hypothetical protein
MTVTCISLFVKYISVFSSRAIAHADSLRDFCGLENCIVTGFSTSTHRFSPIIPSIFHIHLHFNTTLTKRTSRISYLTQHFCFGYRGTMDRTIFSHWFLFSLQRVVRLWHSKFREKFYLVASSVILYSYLMYRQECTYFPNILVPTQNSRRHKSDMDTFL